VAVVAFGLMAADLATYAALRSAPLSDDAILLIEAVDPQLVRLVRRARPAIGLLVVADGQAVDPRALLDAGADDVLCGASLDELVARVRALARRRSVVAGGPWGDNAPAMTPAPARTS